MSTRCPGTGVHGDITEQVGGDDWYVRCPVCGTRWAGGSYVVEPHDDARPASQRGEEGRPA